MFRGSPPDWRWGSPRARPRRAGFFSSGINLETTMSSLNTERVLNVRHWNDTLFSFTTTRNPGLRFENGQFVMMGLQVDGKPLLRAYSIASANHEEHLEFFSIKVPHG